MVICFALFPHPIVRYERIADRGRDSGQEATETRAPRGSKARTSLLRSAAAGHLSRPRDVIYMSPVIPLRRKRLCGIVLTARSAVYCLKAEDVLAANGAVMACLHR